MNPPYSNLGLLLEQLNDKDRYNYLSKPLVTNIDTTSVFVTFKKKIRILII